MASLTIVDYGAGNLLSVQRAFRHLGIEPNLAKDAAGILGASHLVLPGVGAFAAGMAGLTAQGLVEPIRAYAASGRPLLGICLGMQMLMDSSEEFGATQGLGLIPGCVERIPDTGADGRPHRVPHIGWNALVPAQGDWAGSLLDGTAPHSPVYFVHSFHVRTVDPGHMLAVADYDGRPLGAVVRAGAVTGCQFHPEKSGEVGLAMLRRFLDGSSGRH